MQFKVAATGRHVMEKLPRTIAGILLPYDMYVSSSPYDIMEKLPRTILDSLKKAGRALTRRFLQQANSYIIYASSF
jgi:hypothetical protein